jgi:TPR repeat protein
MYEDGQGVTQNYTEAIKWYTLAAEQKEPMAQSNLGHLYANEQTGKLDYVQAHKWFNISGAKEKENIEKLMSPNHITEAQKLAREWINEHKKH